MNPKAVYTQILQSIYDGQNPKDTLEALAVMLGLSGSSLDTGFSRFLRQVAKQEDWVLFNMLVEMGVEPDANFALELYNQKPELFQKYHKFYLLIPDKYWSKDLSQDEQLAVLLACKKPQDVWYKARDFQPEHRIALIQKHGWASYFKYSWSATYTIPFVEQNLHLMPAELALQWVDELDVWAKANRNIRLDVKEIPESVCLLAKQSGSIPALLRKHPFIYSGKIRNPSTYAWLLPEERAKPATLNAFFQLLATTYSSNQFPHAITRTAPLTEAEWDLVRLRDPTPIWHTLSPKHAADTKRVLTPEYMRDLPQDIVFILSPDLIQEHLRDLVSKNDPRFDGAWTRFKACFPALEQSTILLFKPSVCTQEHCIRFGVTPTVNHLNKAIADGAVDIADALAAGNPLLLKVTPTCNPYIAAAKSSQEMLRALINRTIDPETKEKASRLLIPSS